MKASGLSELLVPPAETSGQARFMVGLGHVGFEVETRGLSQAVGERTCPPPDEETGLPRGEWARVQAQDQRSDTDQHQEQRN